MIMLNSMEIIFWNRGFIVHLEKKCVFLVLKGKNGLAVHIYKEFMRQTHSRLYVCINTHKHLLYTNTIFIYWKKKTDYFIYYQTSLDSRIISQYPGSFFCCNRILLELVDTVLVIPISLLLPTLVYHRPLAYLYVFLFLQFNLHDLLFSSRRFFS